MILSLTMHPHVVYTHVLYFRYCDVSTLGDGIHIGTMQLLIVSAMRTLPVSHVPIPTEWIWLMEGEVLQKVKGQ